MADLWAGLVSYTNLSLVGYYILERWFYERSLKVFSSKSLRSSLPTSDEGLSKSQVTAAFS